MRLTNPALRDDTIEGVVTRIHVTHADATAASAASSFSSPLSSSSLSSSSASTVRISIQPDGRVAADDDDDDGDNDTHRQAYALPAEVVVTSWDALTPLPDVQIALQVPCMADFAPVFNYHFGCM